MIKKIVGMVSMMLMMAASGGYAEEPQGWKLELTPYLWYAGIEGDLTVDGNRIDFDRSASELFDAADVGGSLLAVAQYNRVLFWAQGDYLSLSTDELDVDQQPEIGSLDSKMMLGEAAVGYQVVGWSEGQTFDLLVGARYLTMENDLTIFGVGTRERTRRLLDPMLVVRPSIPISNNLRFNPTLGIGGGGDSDLVYELQPQLQYQFTENVAARLSYRRVGYKITGERDNELNFALSGLILGLGVTF